VQVLSDRTIHAARAAPQHAECHNEEEQSMNNQDFTSATDASLGSPGQPGAASLKRPSSIHLTPREAEIVRYVMLGESNKQIARRLGISNYTVRDHVSNLLKKSGVTSRSRLALVLPTPPVQPSTTAYRPGASGAMSVMHEPNIDFRQGAGPEAPRAPGAPWRK
jgi:DNA-binding CsgD family transcriptional regulator